VSRTRIGVIGAGWWATANHIPLLAKRPDVELAAVCRLGPEKLQQIKDHFGFRFATEDYRELLAQDLDGVLVCSPHDLHYTHASAALQRGLHVMCEKPLTLRAREAWELVRLAREQQRYLLVPYGWHYKRFVQEAKKVMEDGAVGEIEYVLCHMASPTKDFFAGQGAVPAEWTPTLSAPEPGTWKDPARGGGYAYGQIVHSSGVMFWLSGLRAQQVAARVACASAKVDLYDCATVTFRNGALGVVSGAATLPDGDPFQVDVRIFGSRGVLLLDAEAGRERVQLRRHDGKHWEFSVTAGDGGYHCEGPPNRFVELVQGRGENWSPGEVGAASVELIEAMFLSASEGGRPVEVEAP
jgi:predicted dehydrogenase